MVLLLTFYADQSLPIEGVDKSTASEAVAFVIRASRRGVVSLCAEVADILKERNRLITKEIYLKGF